MGERGAPLGVAGDLERGAGVPFDDALLDLDGAADAARAPDGVALLVLEPQKDGNGGAPGMGLF